MKAAVRALSALILGSVLTATHAPVASAQVAPGSLVSLSTQPSMNVFRRFAADRTTMADFYGKVLGLRPMAPIGLGGGNQMIRFQVGTAEIKLQGTPAAKAYPAGAVKDVTGLRVFTFFFPDEAALTARFIAHGYSAPAFRTVATDTPAVPGLVAIAGVRRAMVLDPERQWVELVVTPGPPETYERMEVGLTVSDLEKSRAFYRSFIGLEELKPVEDALVGAMKYPFRHGTMTVNLWSFGSGLPANTRTAGIQYVVRDATVVDAKAKAEYVTIDQPLGGAFAGLKTIWLGDPDGITNYFAEILPRSPAAVPAAAPVPR